MNNLRRRNITPEYLASESEGAPVLSRAGAREAAAAIKAWSKAHPNPIAFTIQRNLKPDTK